MRKHSNLIGDSRKLHYIARSAVEGHFKELSTLLWRFIQPRGTFWVSEWTGAPEQPSSPRQSHRRKAQSKLLFWNITRGFHFGKWPDHETLRKSLSSWWPAWPPLPCRSPAQNGDRFARHNKPPSSKLLSLYASLFIQRKTEHSYP